MTHVAKRFKECREVVIFRNEGRIVRRDFLSVRGSGLNRFSVSNRIPGDKSYRVLR